MIAVRTAVSAESGADLVAAAIGGRARFGAPLIVVSYGTATVFIAISPDGEYLGVAIAPGITISIDALVGRTAKLPQIALEAPERAIGRNDRRSAASRDRLRLCWTDRSDRRAHACRAWRRVRKSLRPAVSRSSSRSRRRSSTRSIRILSLVGSADLFEAARLCVILARGRSAALRIDAGAGYVDAVAFFGLGVFTANMTGNTVLARRRDRRARVGRPSTGRTSASCYRCFRLPGSSPGARRVAVSCAMRRGRPPLRRRRPYWGLPSSLPLPRPSSD